MAWVFEWKTSDQVMVLWCENLVVGFYTIFKIPLCRPVDPDKWDHYPVAPTLIRWVVIPFFLLHFLMFCAMHLALINMLFSSEVESYAEAHRNSAFPEVNFNVVLISLCALFVNHGISYGLNFIKQKEYLRFKMDEMMFVPYKRLLLVHGVVMTLGLLLSVTGIDSVLLILIFFTVKCWIDLRRHKAEHNQDRDSLFGWY